MRNINIHLALWLIIGLSGIIWVALGLVSTRDLVKPLEFISLLPKVITIDAVIISIFVKWGWRIPLLRPWLVPFPDLNGTWVGQIHSIGPEEETGTARSPIPAILTVRQTFFHVSCVMQTDEMRSDSFAEGFRIDLDRQVRELIYSYDSRPKMHLQDRSPRHEGTGVIEVIESPERRLRGRYWNERRGTGELEFVYHSKKILEEMPADMPSHPMSE